MSTALLSAFETLNVRAYLHPAVRLQVVLTGVPLVRGLLTLTGCRLTALGVTWKQPWTPLVGAGRASSLPVSQDAGGLAQVIACIRPACCAAV